MNLIDPFQFREMFGSARSFAMVGNAPTILEYENGATIDSHDMVVRFNRATTEGMETKIGGRTDILVVNASNSRKMAPPPTETVKPRCLVCFVSPGGVPNVDYEAFADWTDGLPTFLVFGPEMLGLPSQTRTRPVTSGTYFIFTLLRMLNVERLFVTGFTMFGAVAGGAAKYYRDDRPNIGGFHDLDIEKQLFREILATANVKLDMTPEVESLLGGAKRRPGRHLKDGVTRQRRFRHWLANGLSWRLMSMSMRLRRIAEST